MSERGDLAEPPFSELSALAAPAALPPRPAGPWSARLLEQVLHYLPVLVIGLLAAASWWLVKNTPVPGDEAVVVAPSASPDYTMRGFVLSTYAPDGALRSQLEGDVMQHFPATDTVKVEGVRLRSVDAAGRLLLGRALRAQSNGDATRVRLIGGANVVREPGPGEAADARVEIRGEFLEVSSENESVRSHLPVTLLTGAGELRAGTLDYSHAERIARLGGRVTGQLRPGRAPTP